MIIAVDARPLSDRTAGGVRRVVSGLLPALIEAMPDDRFVLVTTGLRRPELSAGLARSPPPRHSRAGGNPAERRVAQINRGFVTGFRSALDSLLQGNDGEGENGSVLELSVRAEHVHRTIPNKLWSLLTVLGLASLDQLVRPTKPDLLLLFNLGFVGRPKVPYALLVHDISFLIEPMWFSLKARVWHRVVRAKRLIREAKQLFAVSERTKRDLVERLGIDERRIAVVPIGMTTVRLQGERRSPLQNKRYVICLGANDPRKNCGCVRMAVQQLRADPLFQDVLLVLIGPISSYVPGEMPLNRPTDAALTDLMKNASALLYPSWYEGFGLPLHEAARFGTPCIASTAGALPETAPEGTIFVPPSKPALWMAAIKMVLENEGNFRTKTKLTDWSEGARRIKLPPDKGD